MASLYSESQISAFLAYIGFSPFLQAKRYSNDPKEDLHLLTQLHIHTISTIPYENLLIHYSKAHSVSINPLHVYDKIVTAKRGRGGYCFEVNLLFNHILRGLGFPVYTAPVRVRYRVEGVPEGDFKGWAHVVNIVQLADGTKWMSDTGFGGDGATAPLQLVENVVRRNLGTQENRLVLDHIPTQTLRTPESRLWIYQYRNGPEQKWNSFYAFAEIEAMQADFEIFNWFTGHSAVSFQTFRQVVVKFLRREVEGGVEGDAEICGKRLLVDGIVKENLGGKTHVLRTCVTENERIEALKEDFGIVIAEEEREGIKGWATELR